MANLNEALALWSIGLIIAEDTNKLRAIQFSKEIKFEDLVAVLSELKGILDEHQHALSISLLLRAMGASDDLSDCIHLELDEWTFDGGKPFNALTVEQLTALLSAMPLKFEYIKIATDNNPSSWQSRKNLENWLNIKKFYECYKPFFAQSSAPANQDQNPRPPQAGCL